MRLREYFHQSKHLSDTVTRRNLLDKMSPQLAGEVALQVNERWLRRVWFLNGAGREFVVQVALQLEAMVFTIGEVINNGYLYIINRGIALFGGRVLTAGAIWGEDMLLDSQWLVTKHCARAMTYLEVYTISRDQLMDAARLFPQTIAHLRRCAIRLAIRREFIRLSKLELAEREASMGLGTVEKDYLISRMLDKASGLEPLRRDSRPRTVSPQAQFPPTPPEVVRRITQNEASGGDTDEANATGGEQSNTNRNSIGQIAINSELAQRFAKLEKQQVSLDHRLHRCGPLCTPCPRLCPRFVFAGTNGKADGGSIRQPSHELGGLAQACLTVVRSQSGSLAHVATGI